VLAKRFYVFLKRFNCSSSVILHINQIYLSATVVCSHSWIASSCSIYPFSKVLSFHRCWFVLLYTLCIVMCSFAVTPMDVIKIRMQSPRADQKCFLYCNGLMDHLCYCMNGNSTTQTSKWYKRPGQFTGTFVSGAVLLAVLCQLKYLVNRKKRLTFLFCAIQLTSYVLYVWVRVPPKSVHLVCFEAFPKFFLLCVRLS